MGLARQSFSTFQSNAFEAKTDARGSRNLCVILPMGLHAFDVRCLYHAPNIHKWSGNHVGLSLPKRPPESGRGGLSGGWLAEASGIM